MEAKKSGERKGKIFGEEKYLVNGGGKEQRKKRKTIFKEGKRDDGQMDRQTDRQTEFPLVLQVVDSSQNHYGENP